MKQEYATVSYMYNDEENCHKSELNAVFKIESGNIKYSNSKKFVGKSNN